MTINKLAEWVNEQIALYEKLEEEEWLNEAAINSYLGKIEAFKAVKERLTSLLTNTDNTVK